MEAELRQKLAATQKKLAESRARTSGAGTAENTISGPYSWLQSVQAARTRKNAECSASTTATALSEELMQDASLYDCSAAGSVLDSTVRADDEEQEETTKSEGE